MNAAVFDKVRKSLERMQGPTPRWLEEGKTPNFEYHEQGTKGPVIILLHGLLGALSNWDSVLPLFADFSRAIALKFPISTGHSSEVRIKSLAAFTEFFIRQNNFEKVILCGNSLGGHVALRVALSSPDLVDSLILSGSSGLYEHTADSLPVRPKSDFIRSHMKRVFVNQKFITDEGVNEILEILSKRSNHLNLIHAARSAKRDNLQKVLPQVNFPTLLLWGEEDEITTMGVAKIFDDLIPDSKLITIGQCGHAPMIEHPEWFSQQVKTFLAERSELFKNS